MPILPSGTTNCGRDLPRPVDTGCRSTGPRSAPRCSGRPPARPCNSVPSFGGGASSMSGSRSSPTLRIRTACWPVSTSILQALYTAATAPRASSPRPSAPIPWDRNGGLGRSRPPPATFNACIASTPGTGPRDGRRRAGPSRESIRISSRLISVPRVNPRGIRAGLRNAPVRASPLALTVAGPVTVLEACPAPSEPTPTEPPD